MLSRIKCDLSPLHRRQPARTTPATLPRRQFTQNAAIWKPFTPNKPVSSHRLRGAGAGEGGDTVAVVQLLQAVDQVNETLGRIAGKGLRRP